MIARALFGLALLGAGAGASAAEPLRFVTGDDYPPYADRELEEGGFATALVSRIFEAAGFAVVIEWRDWRSGYVDNVAGLYAGAFPYVPSAERLQANLFSDPLFTVRTYLYSRAEDAFGVADTLRDRILCLPGGFAPPDRLDALLKSGDLLLRTPRTLIDCVEVLHGGRADLLAVNASAFADSVASAGLDAGAFHRAEPAVREAPHHFIVSRARNDAERLILLFNRGIKALRESGEYDALAERMGAAG